MQRSSLSVTHVVDSVFSSRFFSRLSAIGLLFPASSLTSVPPRILRSLVASLVAFTMVLVGFVSPAAAVPQLEAESDQTGSLISISNGDRSGGMTHTLVVSGDGKVYAVGDNSEGQLGIGSSGSNTFTPEAVDVSGVLAGKVIVSVAAGNGHSLALDSSGVVYSWGANRYGQLGNGTTTRSTTPLVVGGLLEGKTIVAISAGPAHSLALDSAGVIYAWGSNGSGELGIGSTTASLVPVVVSATGVLEGKDIVSIAAGGEPGFMGFGSPNAFSYAITEAGQLVSWGSNRYGQLGIGNTSNATSPVLVDAFGVLSGKAIAEVSLGGGHVVALDDAGVGYTWGDNSYGQLTTGDNDASSTPVLLNQSGVLSGKTLAFGVAGVGYSVVVDTQGARYGIGRNDVGQLGDGTQDSTTVFVSAADAGLASGELVLEVAAGNQSGLLRTSLGRVLGWGINANGELGIGFGTYISKPIALEFIGALAGKQLIEVYQGFNGASFLDSQGNLYAVGNNDSGELGDGTRTGSFSPVLSGQAAGLLTGKQIVDFSVGIYHTIALDSEGKVYGWGQNTHGQIGTGSTSQSEDPQVIGGLLSGKTIVDIAVGGYHSLALDSDGVVYVWGLNQYGQLGLGDTANKLSPTAWTKPVTWSSGVGTILMEGGDHHTLIVDPSGQVFGFGQNWAGQVGNNSTANATSPQLLAGGLVGKRVTQISSSMWSNLALDSDGKVYAWGNNSSGHLGLGNDNNTLLPTLVSGGTISDATITQVSVGYTNSFALDALGNGYGWGVNYQGQAAVASTAGLISLPQALDPNSVLAGKTLTKIRVTRDSTAIAFDSQGNVYGWGENYHGTLGIGSSFFFFEPKATLFGSVVIASAGSEVTEVGAAPYLGPVLQVTNRAVQAGSDLVIAGSNLSGVSSVSVAGLQLEIELLSATSLRIVVPKSLAAGSYDLVVVSSSGRIVVQGGLVVAAAKPVVGDSLVVASTKLMGDSTAKFYAMNLVGAGKVQFLLNGKEIAWVRATAAADPKLRVSAGADYLVRTVNLEAGSNLLEVLVDGKSVFTATEVLAG